MTDETTKNGPDAGVTVTVWLQLLVFPQRSVASHVRIAAKPPLHTSLRLVTVAKTSMMTLVPLAPSLTSLGSSNVQSTPQETVLPGRQVRSGGVVSNTRTVWEQELELPQASIATQERTATYVPLQSQFVVVEAIASVGLGSQSITAEGASKSQSTPNS